MTEELKNQYQCLGITISFPDGKEIEAWFSGPAVVSKEDINRGLSLGKVKLTEPKKLENGMRFGVLSDE